MIENASAYSPVRNGHGTHLLTSSSEHYSSFLDESYFSVLVSPRQSKTFSVVKLLCNTVFVFLFGVKLKFSGLPWITVFLPTFLSNAITFMTIKEEMKYIWATMGSNMAALCRPIAYACDALGSISAKIVLLTFLMTKPKDYFNTETSASPRSVWTTALTPLWIFVGLSTILRLIPYYPASATRAYKTKHLLAMLLSTLAYFLFRWLQPWLISLRMDNIVEHRWSIIFAPSWVLTFFGLACSVLMVSLSPFVNGFTNGDFRVATQRLLYISAFQMTAISVASIFFLVLVTQKLDFRDDALTGWNHDSVRVLAPILALFIALILTQPLLARTMLRYQQMVIMRNMTQHRPTGPDDGTGDPSQNICYRKVEKITWLMQTTQSGTTYTVTDGRDVSHLLAHSSSSGAASLSPSASFTSYATAAGAVAGTGRSTLMLQHDAAVTHDDDQRVHEHLDIFSSWFTPSSSYHGKSPKKASGRVQPMEMKHGDIELGPMKSDTLDTELPSPTLSASSSFVGQSDGAPAVVAISPFLTDHAFDTGMNPCVVCMARPINTILMTCGHAVVCLHCVLLLGKRKQTAHCPVCRAQIQSWFHLQQAPFEVASPPQAHQNHHQDNHGTTAATNIVRLAVASREYQLLFPPSSTSMATATVTTAAPSATTTPNHPPTVAESVNAAHVQHFSHNHYQQRAQAAEHWTVIDYQLHVPAHDALLDILFP